MASINDKFKEKVHLELDRLFNLKYCQAEFEDRAGDLKRKICYTYGQLDYFIQYCRDKYGFIP